MLAVGSWLTLNPSTGELTINASLSNVGHNYLTVTVTDNHGAQYSQNTDILINGAPIINASISNLYATSGIAFAWKLPDGVFIDADE